MSVECLLNAKYEWVQHGRQPQRYRWPWATDKGKIGAQWVKCTAASDPVESDSREGGARKGTEKRPRGPMGKQISQGFKVSIQEGTGLRGGQFSHKPGAEEGTILQWGVQSAKPGMESSECERASYTWQKVANFPNRLQGLWWNEYPMVRFALSLDSWYMDMNSGHWRRKSWGMGVLVSHT